MRRMVYIVIAFTGLIVAAVVFVGCMSDPAPKSEEQLMGMSLSQNHMDFGYCYSFYLREEDDKVLFDAEVRFDEEPYCIILESCEVDRTHLNDLRKLDEEHAITSYVTTYKSKPSLFELDDKTVNKTTVYLSDGTDKSADTKEDHIDVLYNFFLDLAKAYNFKSVYVSE